MSATLASVCTSTLEIQHVLDDVRATVDYVAMCADDALDRGDFELFHDLGREFHGLTRDLDAANLALSARST